VNHCGYAPNETIILTIKQATQYHDFLLNDIVRNISLVQVINIIYWLKLLLSVLTPLCHKIYEFRGDGTSCTEEMIFNFKNASFQKYAQSTSRGYEMSLTLPSVPPTFVGDDFS
jgi:hypothetical protein